MIISELESKEYGKHYGAKKSEYLALGEGLSSASNVSGTLRAIYDTLSFESLGGQDDVFLCWKFPESSLILGGTIRIVNFEAGSASIQGKLFSGTTGSSSEITPIFSVTATDAYSTNDELVNKTPIVVPKGAAFGFQSDTGDIISGVEIVYSLTYMSSL